MAMGDTLEQQTTRIEAGDSATEQHRNDVEDDFVDSQLALTSQNENSVSRISDSADSIQLRPAPPSPKPTDSTSPSERATTISSSVTPIPPKPASYYAQGAEEPAGMTKKEGDSCLTCLSQGRRCKGTELTLVKGRKRCAVCTKPGTKTSGRICYWRAPDKGINTYEDAQNLLAEEYGGRILAKNTRVERAKRQQAQSQDGHGVVSDGEQANVSSVSNLDRANNDNGLGTELADDTKCEADSRSNAVSDLWAAAESAHQGFYAIIAEDLGLREEDVNVTTTLVVEYAIRKALTGLGPYQGHMEEVDEEIRQVISSNVESNIDDLEDILRNENEGTQEQRDEE